MNPTFSFTKWNHPRIGWWSFQIFAFCIPISQYVGIKLLLVLLAYSLYIIFATKNYAAVFRQGWDGALYLAVLLAGLTYTKDIAMGWKVIESSLSFIAVPVIFSIARSFYGRSYFRLFSAFTAGLLVACLICLGHSAWIYFQTGSTGVFFFYQLTSVINFQPTYMAYFLIFSITFLVYSFYYDRMRLPRILPVGAVIILFATLLLTGGLTSMISLIFIFSFFILKFLQDQKTSGKAIAIGLIVFMIAGMFTFNSADRNGVSGTKNDYWERAALWESALRATPNLTWGVGTGDFTVMLNKYYETHDLASFADLNANSHNEFTQILLSNGLPGLIALLILLGRPLYASVSNRNMLGILTFFPFFIYGITEVFLGRYQGVIFFMFLHQVFLSYNGSTRTSGVLKSTVF